MGLFIGSVQLRKLGFVRQDEGFAHQVDKLPSVRIGPLSRVICNFKNFAEAGVSLMLGLVEHHVERGHCRREKKAKIERHPNYSLRENAF
jgi:hypothetical protein